MNPKITAVIHRGDVVLPNLTTDVPMSRITSRIFNDNLLRQSDIPASRETPDNSEAL